MINAYDEIYLEKARASMGWMLDYAVNDMKLELAFFWKIFLASDVCKRLEKGDVSILAGKSGVELALLVMKIDKDYTTPFFSEEKSKDYWLGWALAYYQWKTCMSFAEITEFISIDELRALYSPYHEMDIRQFCDRVTAMHTERRPQIKLKRRRLALGLSQSQLANLTGIPVRTIQQYEQGQKDINNARAEYVITLARALYCAPELLLENIH